MKTIKPAKNQIFAKATDKETTTKSGIILSERAVDDPQTAEVINIGSAVKDYAPKDIIVYKPFTTTEIKIEGEEYLLIEDLDILGTVIDN